MASLLLLHMNSNSVFFIHVVFFTCKTHPLVSGACRAMQSVHVRIVVAIKKKKKKSEYSFCEETIQLFSFLQVIMDI